MAMFSFLRFPQANEHSLPDEALAMIRFHSFYPYHSCGAYDYLANEKDARLLPWIREFNKFDLYTKCPDMPDIEELKPYYQVKCKHRSILDYTVARF